MLITKEVEVGLKPQTVKWYEDKGYKIPRIFKNGKMVVERFAKIIVNVNDLPDNSHVLVDIKCDNCGKETLGMELRAYRKYMQKDGKYFCHECVRKLYGDENRRISRLRNGKSFYQWCIENNRQDVLDRWDYALNKYKPDEIGHGSNIKIYLNCPRKIHKSELKSVKAFTNGQEGSIKCNQCNSFAQWGIDNLGEGFLEKYWDYEKNTVSPWETDYASKTTIYIKCQEKDYHGSYDTKCGEFSVTGRRCPYCGNFKVHPLDSLGALYPDVLKIWSDKNSKSPFKYSYGSGQEVWWKCSDGKHKDFKRSIHASNTYNFRCPECNYSKGEERINNYCTDNKVEYEIQKTFDGLRGIGNGLLSYDSYLHSYNLLIEYQGEQHERYIPGFHKSIKDFEKQVEHDRRKREYAEQNKYNFLEIWYWDFGNIEEILSKALSLQKSDFCILKEEK